MKKFGKRYNLITIILASGTILLLLGTPYVFASEALRVPIDGQAYKRGQQITGPNASSVTPREMTGHEDTAKILDRMLTSISKLKNLWAQYATKETRKNSPLFIAERIVAYYFRDDIFSNKLNLVSAYLQTYKDFKEQDKPRDLKVVEIEGKIEFCEKIIARYENTQIDKLQDDEGMNSFIEYLLKYKTLAKDGITEEGILTLADLSPEEIRAIITRYINDSKPVIQGLKQDLNKLKSIIAIEKLPGITIPEDSINSSL